MGKLQTGKTTILTLVATLVAAGVLLSYSYNTISAGNDKITICHASGLTGTTKFETLNLDNNAVYANSQGNGGHFNEDGTPAAGHEDDYFGECKTVSATPTPIMSPAPTCTPTATPADLCTDPINDPDDCPLAASTPTASPSATPTASPIDNNNSINSGGDNGGDGLGCATHDCSNQNNSIEGTGTGGQVLGASTMAATGSYAETFYEAIMGVGGTLSAFGLKGLKNKKKNGNSKKAVKKAAKSAKPAKKTSVKKASKKQVKSKTAKKSSKK